MSEFLDAFCDQAVRCPDALAFFNGRGERLTYAELDAQANSLASFLLSAHALESGRPKRPVALIGHKEPAMLVGMIACMKAGHPYVPLDSSLPSQRIEGILDQLDDPVVIAATSDAPGMQGLDKFAAAIVSHDQLRAVLASPVPAPDGTCAIAGEDPHYILFTSGSTGKPKGVIQPARSMDCTYRYFKRFIPEGTPDGAHLVFFNRAHYSFDLSIFDLAIALPFGHTLFALTEDEEESLSASFAALGKADPALWVSTPSYLDMCLVDPSFSPDLLPSLDTVVVCGETLHNSTACKLLDRFPGIRLFNTYGPTETQGAITDVLITRGIAERPEPLPVGRVSPFNELWIADPDTGERLADDRPGEVVIGGGTVASGYYARPDLTERAFGVAEGAAGVPVAFYRTGDEGFIDADGLLHFLGRFDLQVKVSGYRIELEEIEEALRKTDGVVFACVIPVERRGTNVALAAHVVVEEDVARCRETSQRLKEHLRKTLPAYMIPRTFVYHESLPQNANGKIDRKALAR